MSAPEEYETEARLGYRDVREPYASRRAPSRARSVDHGRPRPPASRPPRWGSLPARRGVVVVLSAAAIGAVVSLVTGRGPGAVLGVLLAVGSVAAAFAVHFRRAYLLIPVPAPAYVVAATATGMFHDRGVDISRTALAVSATQWFAGGFPWMAAATILVISITTARWLMRRDEPDPAVSRSERDPRPGRSGAGVSRQPWDYPDDPYHPDDPYYQDYRR